MRTAPALLLLCLAACATTAPRREEPVAAPRAAEAAPPAEPAPAAPAEPNPPAAPPVEPVEPSPPAAAPSPTGPTPPAPPPVPRDPKAAQAHYQRGVAALGAREVPQAIEALGACVAANPQRNDCRWELGWALFLGARWLEARDAWREVARTKPNDPEVKRALELVEAQARVQERLAASEAQPAPPLTPPPASARLRLRAVGDVMLGTSFPEGLLPPDDGAHLLDAVRPLLTDADVTFANLEGPLCDAGTTLKCKKGSDICYAFRQPTRYAEYLVQAGVDVVSVANNHVGDFGEVCRRQTEATLDARRIAWSGPPGSVASLERNGLSIAVLGFHTAPFTNFVLDVETAVRLVREARRTHHLVIVSFHGGAEGADKLHVPEGTERFHGEDRGDLRRFAHAVVDAGADLVLGHGPHVLRAMEVYRGHLVAYSLGNFATYGPFTLTGPLGIGAVLEVELGADGRFTAGRLFPTRQVGQGVPEPDPEARALEQVRTLSREDFPQTGVEVRPDGTLVAPAAGGGA